MREALVKRRSLVSRLIPVVALVGIAGGAGVHPLTTARAQVASESHCVLTPTSYQCYATLAEARTTYNSTTYSQVTPNNTTLGYVLWSDVGESGSSLFIENYRCSGDGPISIANNFNDITSSVQSYACNTITLHEKFNGTGSSDHLYLTRNVDPGFNDLASSFSFQ